MNPHPSSDPRFDLWPLRDVTPSDRPQRYAAYSMQQMRRGAALHPLREMAYARTQLSYWKRVDPTGGAVAKARADFLNALSRSRQNEGPRLPGEAEAMRKAA